MSSSLCNQNPLTISRTASSKGPFQVGQTFTLTYTFENSVGGTFSFPTFYDGWDGILTIANPSNFQTSSGVSLLANTPNYFYLIGSATGASNTISLDVVATAPGTSSWVGTSGYIGIEGVLSNCSPTYANGDALDDDGPVPPYGIIFPSVPDIVVTGQTNSLSVKPQKSMALSSSLQPKPHGLQHKVLPILTLLALFLLVWMIGQQSR